MRIKIKSISEIRAMEDVIEEIDEETNEVNYYYKPDQTHLWAEMHFMCGKIIDVTGAPNEKFPYWSGNYAIPRFIVEED